MGRHGQAFDGQEQELSDFSKHIGPNTWQRLATTQAQCETEIKSFYKKVEEWAGGKDTFHGHWIRTVHAKHLAEEISYQLFIEGMPFGVGSGAVRLFTLPQQVKMLWSGTPPDVRDQWKKKEDAGELSKETAFGKVVEAAGTLKSCDFGGVLTFWEAASGSFLNIDREKHVLVLIDKTEAAIRSTSLWRADVPALAHSPPEGNLRLVTWQMPCLDLVLLLHRRIEEVVGPNVGSQRRWAERRGNMTCESVGRKRKQAATTYPPPFLSMKDDLLQHGFSARRLRRLGFSASWMRDGGYSLKDMKEGGYSAKEIRGHSGLWFQVKAMRELEYSAKDMKEAGCSAKQLIEGGYSVQQLHRAGYPADVMRFDAGVSLEDLREANYSVKEMTDSWHFSAMDLWNAGFSATELRTVFPWWRLWIQLPGDLQMDIPKELFEKFREVRSAVSHLLKQPAWMVAKALKQHGFTVEELEKAGFSPEELQKAGFTKGS